tara:strand:+ start:17 stop:460 length:444 start_codon:yes stop_codon:yes gene_type:complete
MDLTIGVSTNRKIIEKFFDISLTGWQAVGINDVGNNKVLLWVNLENDRSNATYDDGFISGSKIFQWESQNQQNINTPVIQRILKKEVEVHLFCRLGNMGNHKYMGKLKYMKHENNNPVKILFNSIDYDSDNTNLKNIYNHSSHQNRL